MTATRDDSGAEVAAAPVNICEVFRKEQANERKHLRELEEREGDLTIQLKQLQATEHPNADEVARLKGALERIGEDIDRTRDNIQSIQIDITMFCT